MRKFILTIILLANQIILAQPVSQEWVRTYISGYQGNDGISSMTLDTSGNVIVTGAIGSVPGQNSNFCTIKYNPSGTQLWIAFYNGPGSNSIDAATAIAVDKQGFIYVTGYSEETGFGTDAYCTIKYSPNGAQIWAVRYHRTPHYYDEPEAIAVDKYGNVYVTGRSSSDGSYDGYDYLTIKYDSSGVLQWAKYYNGPANNTDLAHSIAVDEACNIDITGESAALQNTSGFCTIKYNTNGDTLWVRRLDGLPGGGHPNLGRKLVIDKYNNVYVTGISYTAIAPEYCTLKYNTQGIQQWASYYRSPTNSSSWPFAIAVDSNLNVLVTGRSFANNGAEYVTVKYNNIGVQRWIKVYNGPGNSYDEAHDVVADAEGSVYVTGTAQDSSQQNIFMTIKYDSAGAQKWQMSLPGGGVAVRSDKNYNVYVAGSSWISGNLKYTTIKYSQLVGINLTSYKEPKQFNLSQNFPNPFNPVTKIKFDVSSDSRFRGNDNVTLKIFDVLGREIAVLVNQQLKPGMYEVDWDGSNYPSGVYFYRLVVNGYTDTKKMVLLK